MRKRPISALARTMSRTLKVHSNTSFVTAWPAAISATKNRNGTPVDISCVHMLLEARDVVLIEPFSLLKVIFRLPFILHKISRVIRSLKEKECVIKKLQKNV